MRRIYLDYAATAPVAPEVLAAMEPYFSERFGNPGSLHSFGQEAIAALDRSREMIARATHADFRQVVFTASATEANNLALRGAVARFRAAQKTSPRIIASAVEHESVLETARDLAREGVEEIRIPADARGMVNVKKIKESLTMKTAIVSVMYANNEIGTIQPVAEIGKLINEFRAKAKSTYPFFHVDAAQAFQFLDCDAKKLGADLMTISSHKIYGPKGAAALYIPDAKRLEPLIAGGGQEFGLRSGTENVPAIVGFAKAVELAAALRERESGRLAGLRDRLWTGIKKIFPRAELNGAAGDSEKLPNVLNVYFPGREAQDLLTKFDLNGLAVSSGSACRSRALESSYVIEALGHPKKRAKSSVRFSLGRPTTEEEITRAIEIIKEALPS